MFENYFFEKYSKKLLVYIFLSILWTSTINANLISRVDWKIIPLSIEKYSWQQLCQLKNIVVSCKTLIAFEKYFCTQLKIHLSFDKKNNSRHLVIKQYSSQLKYSPDIWRIKKYSWHLEYTFDIWNKILIFSIEK